LMLEKFNWKVSSIGSSRDTEDLHNKLQSEIYLPHVLLPKGLGGQIYV
jgi:hypothetical protein